ncbi:MAG: BatA domain-containing protein [Phycisphaerae bacterium]|nr:BatA domain-containing protein [Phycisphaerae bacterium]
MTFTAWMFLLGSLAVAGPLAAHLLAKPRFKRIPFTMLRFLETGQKDSQSRRRFRDFLVLFLRCLIIVLLAMLFAGPLILSGDPAEDVDNVYYLGLDDSASMLYSDSGKSSFEKMQSEAIDYIRSAEKKGSFNIYTLASGRWANNLTADLAINHIKMLKVSHGSIKAQRFVSDVSVGVSQLSGDTEVSAVVISDFTQQALESFQDVDQSLEVDNVEYKNVAAAGAGNAAIISAHAGKFGEGQLSIDVTVASYGEGMQRRILTGRTNDAESKGLEIEMGGNEQRHYSVQVKIDKDRDDDVFIPVELSLSKGDGLDLDDKYYLAISMPQQNEMNVVVTGKSFEELFLLKTAADTISSMNHYEIINVKSRLLSGFDRSLLKWADILLFTSMPSESEIPVSDMTDFATKGGKMVFFVKEGLDKKVTSKLFDAGILPVMPDKYIARRTYIESKPAGSSESESAEFDSVLKALENYRLGNVTVSGTYQCTNNPESVCQWRFKNGNGFIYSRHVANGKGILINTSADDSMSTLTRSGSSVAFCRYLLGSPKQISEHVFACGEKVLLPATAMEIEFAKSEKPVWVQTAGGDKQQASIADSFIVPYDSGRTGWIKTLAKPHRYAGVNLPEWETDITGPAEGLVGRAIDNIFSENKKLTAATADITAGKNYKSLWKIFAWAVILLIFTEAGLVNRMNR